MAPQLLFDISNIDLSRVVVDVEAIEKVNPHRGAMRMLDGISYIDDAMSRTVAFKDVGDDEFWVAGHIPGRPIFPGVLMIEAAAQLASYVTMMRMRNLSSPPSFLGFIGADKVKFRGQVVPGDRLILLGKEAKFSRRRFICDAQGLVNGTIVFEAQITGMPI